MMRTSSTSPNWLKYSLSRSWLVWVGGLEDNCWWRWKNHLPAESAHKKFCQHSLSSCHLVNVKEELNFFPTLIALSSRALYSWNLIISISFLKSNFLALIGYMSTSWINYQDWIFVNSMCRQKLIREGLYKDKKLKLNQLCPPPFSCCSNILDRNKILSSELLCAKIKSITVSTTIPDIVVA